MLKVSSEKEYNREENNTENTPPPLLLTNSFTLNNTRYTLRAARRQVLQVA